MTRRLLVLALAAAAGLLVLAGSAGATTQAPAEQRFAAAINADRAAAGLPPLQVDVALTRIARDWSGQVAAAGELAHNPVVTDLLPDGWSRWGENVGYVGGATADPDAAVLRMHGLFMGSPGHRANILGDYTALGIGVVVDAGGTMWATENFVRAPIAALGQVDEAVVGSQRAFPAGDSAAFAVLARADVFADALGGSALAGDDAPVLFTPGPGAAGDPVVHPATRAELDRVLAPGATIYLLGGDQAVGPAAWSELAADGYDVRRLGGASRYQTAALVAREAAVRHGAPAEVLLARGDAWYDAIAGGAYAAATGAPIVLTPGDALDPTAAALLAELPGARVVALGGPAALSDAVVIAAGAERVAGPDRTATAVEIARRLWGRTAANPGDRFVVVPGYADAGWAYALAHVTHSAQASAPQLLVGDDLPGVVADYLGGLGYAGVGGAEVLATSTVPAPVTARLQELVAAG